MLIKTSRLLLTEITWNDLENIHQLHLIPQVDEFNTVGIPKNIDETKKIITPSIYDKSELLRSFFTWKVELLETNEFIGLTGMHVSNDKFRIGDIFYKLNPKFWGKGYATEITRKLLDVGFNDFTLHKIQAETAINNVKSIRVLEKVGMFREGIRRKALPIRGEWVDSYIYAINEDDEIQ